MRRVLVGLVMLFAAVSCSSSDDTTIRTADLANAHNIVVTSSTPTPVAPTTAPEPTAAPTAAQESPTETPAVGGDDLFPTVVDVAAATTDGTSWRFDVTLLSEYDSPERYADAWRVLDAQDNELGIRILAHDHAGEQPFTRSTNVELPADVETVFVEGRDQVNGWSGERFEVTLDR